MIRVSSCTANALAAIIQFNHRRFLIFTNSAGYQIAEVQVYLADEN